MSKNETENSARPKKRGGGLRRFLPWLLVAGVVAALVYGLWPRPTLVEAETVTRGPLEVTVFEEGETRIRNRYTILPPVPGYLNRVSWRAGAPIKAGETVLATIRPEMSAFLDPRARAQAEAALKQAQAARQQREAELGRANAALDLGRKDLERSNELVRSGAISRQENDQAENRVEVLEREQRAAQFGLQVAEFEVEQAQAALQQATGEEGTQGETVEILAPVDGFVLNIFEESARVVTPATQIMEVGDLNDMEAEIELLSSDAVAVKPGAVVSIERWGGEAAMKGRVSLVEPAGYTKVSALGVEEQRVRVRVDFTDPLPPGTTLGDRFRVEARITTWAGENVLQVPTGALFRRGNDWMTFVIEDGTARLRTVEIGHNSGVSAEVLSGLEEGAQVVAHPPEGLTDGAAVQVAE